MDIRFFQATATVIPVLFLALAIQLRAFSGPSGATERLMDTYSRALKTLDTLSSGGSLSPSTDRILRSQALARLVKALVVIEGIGAFMGAAGVLAGEGLSLYALAVGRGAVWQGILIGVAIGAASLAIVLTVVVQPVVTAVASIRSPRLSSPDAGSS